MNENEPEEEETGLAGPLSVDAPDIGHQGGLAAPLLLHVTIRLCHICHCDIAPQQRR